MVKPVCERTGCQNLATCLLEWDIYKGSTWACDWHARWWKLGSMAFVLVTPLEGATR